MEEREGPNPPKARAVVVAVLVVFAAGIVVLVALGRSGGTRDEDAVRAWFRSPAGGSAPQELASSIHVGACQSTDATSLGRHVLKCSITTDAPTPTLGTCFVFDDDKVLRGGWQLTALDACNALRFDHRSGQLLDVAARTHYPLTER